MIKATLVSIALCAAAVHQAAAAAVTNNNTEPMEFLGNRVDYYLDKNGTNTDAPPQCDAAGGQKAYLSVWHVRAATSNQTRQEIACHRVDGQPGVAARQLLFDRDQVPTQPGDDQVLVFKRQAVFNGPGGMIGMEQLMAVEQWTRQGTADAQPDDVPLPIACTPKRVVLRSRSGNNTATVDAADWPATQQPVTIRCGRNLPSAA